MDGTNNNVSLRKSAVVRAGPEVDRAVYDNMRAGASLLGRPRTGAGVCGRALFAR